MMQKIELYAEGVAEPQTLSLEAKRGAVVGRAPEAAQRSLVDASEGIALEAVVVPSRAVSSAHVLVHDAGDGAVTVRDLGSINETWLLLARGQSVTVQTDGAPLRIAVGMGGPSWRVRDDPPEPQWKRPQDYPEAVRKSVEQWVRDQGLAVTLTLRRQSEDMHPRSKRADDPSWFVLREGWGLR